MMSTRFSLISLLLLVAGNLSAQDDEDIVNRLMEKYEDVASCMMVDGMYGVKKDGIWEFSDAQGKILTDMDITELDDSWTTFTITVNGQKYEVETPIENGRLLVNRYKRYAYMDRKGKLLTPFIYDYNGEKNFDAAESTEAIRINDIVGDFIEDYKYSSNPPVDKLLDMVTPSNINLLIDDYIEKVSGGLVRYALNNPDKVDKKKLEALFDVMYSNENLDVSTAKAIAAYRYQTSDNDEARFKLLQDMARRFNDAEVYTLCGDMLREGRGCTKNVQEAISFYEKAAIDDSRDKYAENARQALRELWQSDSTRYDNRYGRLLSCYDDFHVIQDYVMVRRGGFTGVCDSIFTEVLPCCYKSVKCLMDPLYAVVTFDDGVQLVKRGGEALTTDNFDDMLIVQYNQDNSFIVFAEKDYKWCMIDSVGKNITPLVFDNVYMPFFSFGETYPTITKDDEEFDLYRIYKSRRAIIRQNDLYGLMDTNGDIVVPCQYAHIEPFEDGVTTTEARTKDDTWVTIELK